MIFFLGKMNNEKRVGVWTQCTYCAKATFIKFGELKMIKTTFSLKNGAEFEHKIKLKFRKCYQYRYDAVTFTLYHLQTHKYPILSYPTSNLIFISLILRLFITWLRIVHTFLHCVHVLYLAFKWFYRELFVFIVETFDTFSCRFMKCFTQCLSTFVWI